MINNTSAILAIIIAERVEAQYATNEFVTTFTAIEEIMQNQINDKDQGDEIIQDVRNHIHHLNEMTYLNAFKDAYQFFLELKRIN